MPIAPPPGFEPEQQQDAPQNPNDTPYAKQLKFHLDSTGLDDNAKTDIWNYVNQSYISPKEFEQKLNAYPQLTNDQKTNIWNLVSQGAKPVGKVAEVPGQKGGFLDYIPDAVQKAASAIWSGPPTGVPRQSPREDAMRPSGPRGLLEQGNIPNLYNRPVLNNPDGTYSTTSSASFEEDGKEVLIPTVVNGKRLTMDQAIDHYKQTGEHLGKFDSPENADVYAQKLHEAQAASKDTGTSVVSKLKAGLQALGSQATRSILGPTDWNTLANEAFNRGIAVPVRAASQYLKGMTLDRYDPETGVLNIPPGATFDPESGMMAPTEVSAWAEGKSVKVLPGTRESLEQMGVSPEATQSNNLLDKASDIFFNFAGAGKPWSEISRGVSEILGPAASDTASQIMRRLETTLGTSFIAGLATPKADDETKAEEVSKTMLGAAIFHGAIEAINSAAQAVPVVKDYWKWQPFQNLKDELSDLLYRKYKADTPEAADKMAADIINAAIKDRGGWDKVTRATAQESRVPVKEALANTPSREPGEAPRPTIGPPPGAITAQPEEVPPGAPKPGESPAAGVIQGGKTVATIPMEGKEITDNKVGPVQSPPPATVRFYHGGIAPDGGPRWITPDYRYAKGYADQSGGVVSYVDVPADSPHLAKSFDDTGSDVKAPYVAFEAPAELAAGLKVMPTAEVNEGITKAPQVEVLPPGDEPQLGDRWHTDTDMANVGEHIALLDGPDPETATAAIRRSQTQDGYVVEFNNPGLHEIGPFDSVEEAAAAAERVVPQRKIVASPRNETPVDAHTIVKFSTDQWGGKDASITVRTEDVLDAKRKAVEALKAHGEDLSEWDQGPVVTSRGNGPETLHTFGFSKHYIPQIEGGTPRTPIGPPPTGNVVPKSYDEAQKLIDDFEDKLEEKYGPEVHTEMMYAAGNKKLGIDENTPNVRQPKIKFDPADIEESERLYAQRDAFDQVEVEQNMAEMDKMFKPLVPNEKHRKQLIRTIALADMPTAIREMQKQDAWRGVGTVANVIAHYISEHVTKDIAQTAFNIRSVIGGTPDDIKIQFNMTVERGLGPSQKTIDETQRWLNHLYPDDTPQMPGATKVAKLGPPPSNVGAPPEGESNAPIPVGDVENPSGAGPSVEVSGNAGPASGGETGIGGDLVGHDEGVSGGGATESGTPGTVKGPVAPRAESGARYSLVGKPPIALTKSQRIDINARVRQLIGEKQPGDPLTEEEKDLLRQYTGNGGLGEATEGVLFEHYTSYKVVKFHWDRLKALGYPMEGATVLEPAGAIGNYVGFAPAGVNMHAVEIDPIAAKVLKLLYPDVKVSNMPFEDFAPKGGYDIVISNVPFNENRGKLRYSKEAEIYKHISTLHDFFFMKSIDLTKPNGLISFISSTGTMDKQNEAIRREMNMKTEFLGAYRTPAGEFKQNTGFGGSVDIIILRKRTPEEMATAQQESLLQPEWVESVQTKDFSKPDQPAANLSKYYMDKPQQAWGKLEAGYGVRQVNRIGVRPTAPIESFMQIAMTDAIKWEPKETTSTVKSVTDEEREAIGLAPPGLRPGSLVLHEGNQIGYVDKDGNLYKASFGLTTKGEPMAKEGTLARIKESISIMADAERLHEALKSNSVDRADVLRNALKEKLDTYQKKYSRPPGYDNYLWRFINGGTEANPLVFADPRVWIMAGLTDKEGALTDIFRNNTLYKEPREPRSFNSKDVGDVARFVYEETGTFNPHEIARLYKGADLDAEGVNAALDGIPGFSVESVDANGNPKMQIDEEYLYGSIWPKIDETRAMLDQVERNPAGVSDATKQTLARQEDLLTQVLPEQATIGTMPKADVFASWMDDATINKWMSTIGLRGTKELDPGSGRYKWNLYGRSTLRIDDHVYDHEMVQDYLNHHRATKKIDTGRSDIRGRSVYKEVYDLEGQKALDKIGDHFADHVKANPDQIKHLVPVYNRAYRSYRRRVPSDQEMKVEGMSATFKKGQPLKVGAHQWEVDAMMLHQRSGINAQGVGSGKTMASIVMMQIAKQRGMIQKPMVIVPAKVIKNWASEINILFPGSTVLDLSNMTAKNRYKTLQRAAATDADFVLITYNGFKEIPLRSAEQYMQEDLNQYEERLRLANENKTDKKTVTMIENQIRKFQEKLAKMQDMKKTTSIFFEDMGVDAVVVDECFPYETLIHTNVGPLPIGKIVADELKVKVLSCHTGSGELEWKPILRWLPKSSVKPLVKVIHEQGEFTCTVDHKVWTTAGYIQAKSLSGHSLRVLPETETRTKTVWRSASEVLQPVLLGTCQESSIDQSSVRMVSSDVCISEERVPQVLLGELCCKVADEQSRAKSEISDRPSPSELGAFRILAEAGIAENERTQPLAYSRSAGKNDGIYARPDLSCAGRKRADHGSTATISRTDVASNGVYDRDGICREEHIQVGSIALQRGSRDSRTEDSDRGGRSFAQDKEVALSGSPQDRDPKFSRVVRVEILEQGSDGRDGQGGRRDQTVYDLEVADNHNYFANGILVSNCHNYKNAPTWYGDMSEWITAAQYSDQASDMMYKTRYIHETRGGRKGQNVWGLTATPTPNNPIEIYTMLKYVAPAEWTERNIQNAGDFVEQFGIVGAIEEPGTTGVPRTRTVFTGYKNLRDLRSIFRRYIDLRPTSAFALKRPNAEYTDHYMIPTPEVIFEAGRIAELDDYVRQNPKEAQAEGLIPLSVLTMARKLAGDLAILNPIKYRKTLGRKGSKIDALMESIKANEAGDNTQLIFIDLYRAKVTVPQGSVLEDTVKRFIAGDIDRLDGIDIEDDLEDVSTDGENSDVTDDPHGQDEVDKRKMVEYELVNLHKVVRDKLIEAGIPADQIAILNQASNSTPKAKFKIQEEQAAGKKRFLIGTTPSMGEGMNLQYNTTDIHHYDVPWTPAALEQRDGRGVRQGNDLEKVRIHRYIGKGTSDAKMYAILHRKAEWNRELWNGEADEVTDFDQDGKNYDDISADAQISQKVLDYWQTSRRVKIAEGQLPKLQEHADDIQERINDVDKDVAHRTAKIEEYNQEIKRGYGNDFLRKRITDHQSNLEQLALDRAKFEQLHNEAVSRVDSIKAELAKDKTSLRAQVIEAKKEGLPVLPEHEHLLEPELPKFGRDPLPRLEAKGSKAAMNAVERLNARMGELNPPIGMSIQKTGAAPGMGDPSLPEAFTTGDPEVDDRVQKALEFKDAKQGKWETVKQAADEILRKATRTFQYLPDGRRYGAVIDRLVQWGHRNEIAKHKALLRLQDTLYDIGIDPANARYKNFVQELAFKDLFAQFADMGLPNDQRLPFGFTVPSLRSAIDRLVPRNRADGITAMTIERHLQHFNEVRQNYGYWMSQIGWDVRDRLQEDYFRRRIISKMEERGYLGVGGVRLQTPTGRSWMRGRVGVHEEDFSLNYLESSYEVLMGMEADINTAQLIHWITDPKNGYNIVGDLKRMALQMNERNVVELLTQMGTVEDPVGWLRGLGRKQAEGFERLGRLAFEGQLPDTADERWASVIEILSNNYGTNLDRRAELGEEWNPSDRELLKDEQMSGVMAYASWLAKNPADEDSSTARLIFKGIQEKKAAIKQRLGNRYVTWQDLAKTVDGFSVWQPRPGNTFFTVFTVQEEVAQAVMTGVVGEMKVDAAQLNKMIAQGGPFKQMVIPTELKETLDRLRPPRPNSVVPMLAKKSINAFKAWTLMNPWKLVKFVVRIASEQDKVLFFYPKALLEYRTAGNQMYQTLIGNRPITDPIMQEWFNRGGFMTMLQIRELGDINELEIFAKAIADYGENWRQHLKNLPNAYLNKARAAINYISAVGRYATFRAAIKDIDENGMPSSGLFPFGASNPLSVMDPKNDKYDQAAKIANELLGPYDRVSEMNRDVVAPYLVPFAKFHEANVSTWTGILKNALNDVGSREFIERIGAEMQKRGPQQIAEAAGENIQPQDGWYQGPKASRLINRRMGYLFLMIMGVGFVGLAAWNEFVNDVLLPGADDEQPDYIKYKPHATLPYRINGKAGVLPGLGTMTEFLSWFGMDGTYGFAALAISQVFSGRISTQEVVQQFAAYKWWKTMATQVERAEKDISSSVHRVKSLGEGLELLGKSGAYTAELAASGVLESPPFRHAAGLINPIIKAFAEVPLHREFGQEPGQLQATHGFWEYVARHLSLGDEYKLATNAKSFAFYMKGIPDRALAGGAAEGESDYFSGRQLVFDYMKTIGQEGPPAELTPSQEALRDMKIALREGDFRAAQNMRDKFVALNQGVRTEKQMEQSIMSSIKNMDPLNGLSRANRAAFLQSLTKDQQRTIEKANEFYLKVLVGAGAQLSGPPIGPPP